MNENLSLLKNKSVETILKYLLTKIDFDIYNITNTSNN